MLEQIKLPFQEFQSVKLLPITLIMEKPPLKICEEDQKLFKKLYFLSLKKPRKSLKPILEFVHKYPDLYEAVNLLTYVYLNLRKFSKAHHLIDTYHKKFPNHLLAKINYGDLLLQKNKTKQVAKLFPSFDLAKNKQSKVYVLEYRSMLLLAIRYHIKTKEHEKAKSYLIIAYRLFPNDTNLKKLYKRLSKQSLFSFLKKLTPV